MTSVQTEEQLKGRDLALMSACSGTEAYQILSKTEEILARQIREQLPESSASSRAIPALG